MNRYFLAKDHIILLFWHLSQDTKINTMKRNICALACLTVALLISSCKQNTEVKTLLGENISIDSTIISDSAMTNKIIPYKSDVDKQMNKVIGYSEKELSAYPPESPLSDLVSDIIQAKAASFLKENKTDSLPLFTLMNIKGFRAPLPKGEIMIRNIFEIMPFENEIVILALNGDSIYSLFNYIAKTNGEGIAGATLVGENKTLKKVLINNKPLDTSKNYLLATSDYLANGGDYFTMITKPLKSENIGTKVREAIIEHIENLNQNKQPVVANVDGRIKIK